MKLRSFAAGAVMAGAALASASAAKAVVILDFEGAGNATFLHNFYNGGTDFGGKSGPNLGVAASIPAATFIALGTSGGTANVANVPSGKTVLGNTFSSPFTLTNAAGFGTGFSLAYSAKRAATVSIFEGVNGQGRLLKTLSLAPQWNNGCENHSTRAFCNWTTQTALFDGVARSVTFTGDPEIFYDDITFGVVAVPEPATWSMMIMGFGLAGAVLRHRRAQLAKA